MAKPVVKDKIHYIAERLGIPRTYLANVLGESETTLRKWSYNSKNVNEVTAERISCKLAVLDVMHMRAEKLSGKRLPSKYSDAYFPGGPGACEYLWRVRYSGYEVVTQDFWQVMRDALHWVYTVGRETLTGYSQQDLLKYRRHRYQNDLSSVANNESLELPVGATRWFDYHDETE